MDYISGWCKSQRRLDGYTAIVTGSNSGIGKETALDFYKRGARIIMACRSLIKAEEAKKEIENEARDNKNNGELVIDKLDLCSLKSVREFANEVLNREDKIQILVNNAGVMMCPEGRTEDGFETHMGSNHLAHALLTLLLLPKLIKSGPSRIVFVSSRIHFFYSIDFDDMNFEKSPYSPTAAYSRSKAANILFARALAFKLREHNIHNVTTYSLHPGVVKTNISRYMGSTNWFFINPLIAHDLTSLLWMKTPKCGAQTSIYCAVDEGCAEESGYYYTDCHKAWMSRQCANSDNAPILWNKTIEMLKIEDYNPFSGTNPSEKYLV